MNKLKIYKDPDIVKIEQLLLAIKTEEISKNVRDLLIEYHNAIAFGICPNFVRKYRQKIEEWDYDEGRGYEI